MSFILESDIQVSCGIYHTLVLDKPTNKVIMYGLQEPIGLVRDDNNFLTNLPPEIKIRFIGSEYYGLFAYDINNVRHEWINTKEGNEHITLSPELKSFVSDTYLPHTISYGIGYKLFLCKDNNLYIKGNNAYMGIKSEDGLKLVKFPFYASNVKIIQIGSALDHSFVLASTGLYSWGQNSYGILGLGDLDVYLVRMTPNKINLPSVVFFAMTVDHMITLDSNNNVWSWGCNSYGKLGLGDTYNRHTPHNLNLQNIISVACSCQHSMGLDANGTLYSWGCNEQGQLGVSHYSNMMSPQKIELKNIISVTCGGSHVIAVDIYSNIYAWGDNAYGQLGLGDFINQYKPHLLDLKF